MSYFRDALQGLGRVLAADVDPNAPALHVADEAIVVPPFTAPEYIDSLASLCQAYDVGLVIPLNDLELPVLARHKERFRSRGVYVLVSEPHVIDVCLDKWATNRLLLQAGLSTPLTFSSLYDAKCALELGRLHFPLIVKPRWGTGSIGVETVYSIAELEAAYLLAHAKIGRSILKEESQKDRDRSVLIQEMLTGIEYGLDVINDLAGNYVTTFVRRKLSMRAGETDKATIVDNVALRQLGEHLSALTRHVAIMDCDVFVDSHGNVKVLELNSRFGGGYPFSHVAGANIPAAIISWLQGKEPRQEWLKVRAGVTASKYDQLVITSPSNVASL